MSVRPIGELVAPIVARAEAMMGFQKMLLLCPTAVSRRRLIIVAHECELINDEESEELLRELAS